MGKSYLYALGIGSNMGERKQNLQNAVSARGLGDVYKRQAENPHYAVRCGL